MLAVAKLLENMGEAVGKLPEELKAACPAIPWRSIKDFRNYLVHQYWDIDHEIVWEIVTRELEGLKRQVERILTESSD